MSKKTEAEAGDVATAVTVGTFDGVHRGHRLVLRTLAELAGRCGLRPLAVTFDPHPLAVVAPDRAPLLLEPLDVRLERLRLAGVEPVVVPFDEELRRLTAAEWMLRLKDDFGARLLVAGYDNTFGSDCRGMRPADYSALGERVGLDVAVAPEAPGVCSSAIRRALGEGDVEAANAMLGYDYEVEGTVEHGRHLGTGLGFPTANVQPAAGLQLPANGVYAAYAETAPGETYPAVVNIGRNPTVAASNPVTVEAHLLGYRGDLYGRRLRLRFVARIRDERRFDSLDALRARIAIDAATARALLN